MTGSGFGRRRSRAARSARRGAVGVLAALLTAVAVIGFRATQRTASAATGVSPSASPSASPIELHSAHGSSFIPALSGNHPIFILALGSDARPGQSLESQRSDAIHLIGVNPALHRATILDFPRDCWVNIPGFGVSKITTAMADGGPNLTVRTIERLTGVRIDFWLLTSFDGLQSMVNGIGGLTVRVTQPMHDSFSGANFNPGVHRFNGKQALSFARDRHSFLQGDLVRTGNQGTLLLAALTRLHTTFAQNPAGLFDWLALGWRQFRTDLSLPTLLDLALTATQIPSGRVNNIVVPSRVGNVGAASVVFILPQARALFADMRRDGVVGR